MNGVGDEIFDSIVEILPIVLADDRNEALTMPDSITTPSYMPCRIIPRSMGNLIVLVEYGHFCMWI
jgi:hypothetical protein